MTGETTTGTYLCGSVWQTVICSYYKACCDVLTEKCNRCKHNKNRSYFEPVEEPYYYWLKYQPYYPQPYYPRYVYDPGPTLTWTVTGGDWGNNTSCFTEG